MYGPYGPESFEEGVKEGYAEVLKYFNYGVLEVDHDGKLTIMIKNVWGKQLYTKTVVPLV